MCEKQGKKANKYELERRVKWLQTRVNTRKAALVAASVYFVK